MKRYNPFRLELYYSKCDHKKSLFVYRDWSIKRSKTALLNKFISSFLINFVSELNTLLNDHVFKVFVGLSIHVIFFH